MSKRSKGQPEKRGKGEGSRPGVPHQHGTKWVQWVTIAGKRKRVTGDTVQDVHDKITALEHMAAKASQPKAPTFGELIDRRLAEYDDLGNTHAVYTYALKHWQASIGTDTPTDEITKPMIESAIAALAAKVARSTLTTYTAALRVVLGDHPALTGVKLPKARKPVIQDDTEDTSGRMLPPDLHDRLLAEAKHNPHGILIGIGLLAGLRAGEAVALRWSDVDLTTGILTVSGSMKVAAGVWVRGSTKTGKIRRFRISNSLLNWLEQHRAAQVNTARLAGYAEPIYVAASIETGDPLSGYVPVAVLRKLLAQVCTAEEWAKWGTLRYHDLRHTHVSLLLAGGFSPANVAQRAGHSPEILLKVYAHAVVGVDEQIAAYIDSVFNPQAIIQANRNRSGSSQSGQHLRPIKDCVNSSEPQTAAASAEDDQPTLLEIRTEPHETAPTSNQISNNDGGAK